MLQILGVSRSGYYSYLKGIISKKQIRKNKIKDKIVNIHETSHLIYGAPKITKELIKQGEIISQRTVSLYMKEMGIRAIYISPYTRTTISEDFSSKLQNILDQNFNPDKPNEAWCTDITYIWTFDGFVYLNCVMDLFSRKIIAWNLSDSLNTDSVVYTIEVAKSRRPSASPLILQTDRGVQYTSEKYEEALNSIKHSYSHPGYPYDNAVIESFHSLIKREWLNRFKIKDIKHAYKLVFEYIETFYNTIRIHSHCNYVSPDEYEKTYYQLH